MSEMNPNSNAANNNSGDNLTPEDIERLIKSPFDKKIDITKKIAEYYKNGGFDAKQMQNAATIFRTLVQDTEVEIRKSLSEAIKDYPNIPHDVVLSLANDVNEVSMPVLQFSEILTDSDLIEIVTNSEDAAKHMCISKRKHISENLVDALVDTQNDLVVGSLLQNKGAIVSEETYCEIVNDYASNEEIMGAIVARASLPVSIVEALAEKISATIYESLKEKHKDSFERMDNILKQTSEMATMKVIGLKSSEAEYARFRNLIVTLKISDDLAPIYALCMGNLNIFEVNIARMTKTPVLNIRTLINDPSNLGFKVLYERAGLPADLYDATSILVTVLRSMTAKNELIVNGISVTKETANQIVTKITKISNDLGAVKNIDYIISLVAHHALSN